MSDAPAAPAAAAPSADDALKLVTLTQVSEHAKKSDCWMAHNGKVYDVTAFLDDHPGGPEIMMEHAGAFVRGGGAASVEGDGPSARLRGWQIGPGSSWLSCARAAVAPRRVCGEPCVPRFAHTAPHGSVVLR